MEKAVARLTRRSVLGAAVAAPLTTLCGAAAAQDKFPSKPITLVLALAPGGAGDVLSRKITQKMAEHMGQTVVIENRPGAGAVAAATVVMQAKPDGYTMLLSGNGSAVSTALFKSLPYNIMKDFRHVSTLAFFDLGIIVDGQSKFGSMADVLAFAKTNPGKLTIGTIRIGSTQHLAAELLKSMAGIEALIVPYKSTADLLGAVRTGDVQMAVEIVPPILGQIQAKSVKLLAVAAAKRFPGFPDVPTVAESGLPGYEAPSWAGLSVPAKTPDAVVRLLAKEVELAVASADVQNSLQALGYVARSSTPEQMTQRLEQDLAKWKGVVEKAKIPKQ